MITRCVSITLIALIFLHTTSAATYTFAKWYMAGSFNGTAGVTATPSSPNIVGLDISKNQYFALGTGTNAVAMSIGQDNCNKLYFAGAFTSASNSTTGPIAIYDPSTGTFSNVPAPLTGFQGVITTINVDCPVTSCACDLWIGGNFFFTASDGTATCVARYSAATQQWFALGGTAAHNISMLASQTQQPVLSVKRMGDQVFFGGLFSGLLQYYTVSAGTWSQPLMSAAAAGTQYGFPSLGNVAVIHDMRVATLGSVQALYIGGNFALETTCSFVCGYNNGGFIKVGGNNQPNGPVFGLSFDNSSLLYIAGNFTGLGGSTPNIAMTTISSTSVGGSDFGQAGAAPSFTLPPVYRIEALDKRYGYNTGAYGYAILGGLGLFYDVDVRTHFPFGTGATTSTSNLYMAIVAQPYVTNNAFITGASMPLIFMCMVVLMFFYNL